MTRIITSGSSYFFGALTMVLLTVSIVAVPNGDVFADTYTAAGCDACYFVGTGPCSSDPNSPACLQCQLQHCQANNLPSDPPPPFNVVRPSCAICCEGVCPMAGFLCLTFAPAANPGPCSGGCPSSCFCKMIGRVLYCDY